MSSAAVVTEASNVYTCTHEKYERKYDALLPNTSTDNSLFVCVEVLRPSQPNGVMSSAVSLPNHTFTGQA